MPDFAKSMINRYPNSLLQPGATAPEFHFRVDTNNPLNTDERSLAHLRSETEVVVLIFFKAECPTCKLAFPFLERIYRRIKNQGNFGAFLAIAQNSPTDAREFFARFGATFPRTTEDEPFEISNLYGVTNVPSILLVDRDGTIRTSIVGFSREALDKLSREITEALGENHEGSLFDEADRSVPTMQPG